MILFAIVLIIAPASRPAAAFDARITRRVDRGRDGANVGADSNRSASVNNPTSRLYFSRPEREPLRSRLSGLRDESFPQIEQRAAAMPRNCGSLWISPDQHEGVLIEYQAVGLQARFESIDQHASWLVWRKSRAIRSSSAWLRQRCSIAESLGPYVPDESRPLEFAFGPLRKYIADVGLFTGCTTLESGAPTFAPSRPRSTVAVIAHQMRQPVACGRDDQQRSRTGS